MDIRDQLRIKAQAYISDKIFQLFIRQEALNIFTHWQREENLDHFFAQLWLVEPTFVTGRNRSMLTVMGDPNFYNPDLQLKTLEGLGANFCRDKIMPAAICLAVHVMASVVQDRQVIEPSHEEIMLLGMTVDGRRGLARIRVGYGDRVQLSFPTFEYFSADNDTRMSEFVQLSHFFMGYFSELNRHSHER